MCLGEGPRGVGGRGALGERRRGKGGGRLGPGLGEGPREPRKGPRRGGRARLREGLG